MEEITALIGRYGADVCLLALIVGVSTGAAKIPLKILSRKKALGNRLNKYITLLPLGFGLLYAGLYQLAVAGAFFTEKTGTLAATSASLSLAVYAILEKFFSKERPAGAIPAAEALPGDADKDDREEEPGRADGQKTAAVCVQAQTMILGKRKDEADTEKA